MTQRRDSLVRLVAGLVGRQNADSCVSRVFKSLILRAIKLYNYPDKARKRQKRQKTIMENQVDAVVVKNEREPPTTFVYISLLSFISLFTRQQDNQVQKNKFNLLKFFPFSSLKMQSKPN